MILLAPDLRTYLDKPKALSVERYRHGGVRAALKPHEPHMKPHVEPHVEPHLSRIGASTTTTLT